jgi:hypothetical protein
MVATATGVSSRIWIGAVVGLLSVTVRMLGQPDTITQNPNAKMLNKIWTIAGNPAGGDLVGEAISGLPDINGDGINEFAVYYATASQWRIFYGAPIGNISHTPDLILDSMSEVVGGPLAYGNFWGDGQKTIVIPKDLGTEFVFLRIDTARKELDTVPIAIIDPRKMTPKTELSTPIAMVAADLDGDGADEFIVAPSGLIRGSTIPRSAEIWIYRGGANFPADTPAVILRDDSTRGDPTALYVGRWDSDHRLDIALALEYDATNERIKFWFSNEESPWNWKFPNRNIVATTSAGGTAVLDCDGDSILDIAMANGITRVNLFRSGSGKDARTRLFTPDDADIILRRYQFAVPKNLGYLADSGRHYAMLGIGGADVGGPTTLLGFSGGPNGPDHAFDAYDFPSPFNAQVPVADVTGDGWDDFLYSYAASNFNAGFAALYAGGPYIPRDPSLGVEYANPVTGVRRDAIQIWPTPAHDELHITWRGDLTHMPARFVVHDVLGRHVANGEVEPWRGEALWRCGDVAPGVYFLTIYDADSKILTTSRVVKS